MTLGQTQAAGPHVADRSAWLVLYRALSEGAGKGAFLVVTIVAARRLPGDAFGLFALGTTIGWMASVAADFGIQLHVARSAAVRRDDAASILQVWLRVRLWTSAVVLATVGGALMVAGVPHPALGTILLFVAAYLVAGLVELLYYFFRGLSRSDLESTLTLANRSGTLVLSLIVLWRAPSATGLAAAMLVSAAVTLAFSRKLAAALAGSGSLPARGWTAAARADLPRIVPVGAGILLSALYFRIDAILVDAWLGPAALGLYNAAFRLVDALRLLPAAVLAVVLPRLFRATSRAALVAVSVFLTAGATLVSALLAATAGWGIPALFGEPFSDAVPAFRILLLAFPLMSLNYALTQQLIGWEGHRAYAAACAAALAFNVALNARLIPLAGIEGAAWTTVGTEVLMTLTCLVALAHVTPAAGMLREADRAAAS